MHRPVLRVAGPVQSRNVVALLGLAAALLIARIPSGFIGLLLLALFVVVVQGIRPRAVTPRPLRWLLLWCLGASFVSVVGFHIAQLPSTRNNFVIMVAICAVSLSVFQGGRTLLAADWLVDGMQAGLLLAWLISVGEAVTGIKMIDILYPSANTAGLVSGNRFYVSALFPNYNDYSCAMVMLCILEVSRLVFQPRVGVLRTLGRWLVLLSASFFIVVMGSRGALIGLLLGIVLVLVLSVRVVDRAAISIRLGLLATTIALGVGAVVYNSSYVQDRSTATRGTIIRNVLQLLQDDPISAVLGFGSYTSYQQAAAAVYGSTLMDPHNVLLEIVIWYGIPALLGYVVVWAMLLRQGFFHLQTLMTWRSVATLTVCLLMPVLGVVPSSTLRYHVFWLWLIAGCAYLLLGQQRRRAGMLTAAAAPVEDEPVPEPVDRQVATEATAPQA